jgi:hypothetical protein
MGTVIRFPDPWQLGHGKGAAPVEPATVIILPVVRVERHGDDPGTVEPGTGTPGRGRRRRASRS